MDMTIEVFPEVDKHGQVILQAITGSHAYGMATKDSDIDRLGVFVAPTWRILELSPPKETIDHTKPDYSFHEVGKFIRLALKANPTILELLFMPEYEVLSPHGALLVDNCSVFLSQRVFNSYGGYAVSQVRRLMKRADGEFSSDVRGRYAKHARQCFRLLLQGQQLLEMGTLDVQLANPDEIMNTGNLPPDELSVKFEQKFEEFKSIKSVLPEKPDYEVANAILRKIREHYLDYQDPNRRRAGNGNPVD